MSSFEEWAWLLNEELRNIVLLLIVCFESYNTALRRLSFALEEFSDMLATYSSMPSLLNAASVTVR